MSAIVVDQDYPRLNRCSILSIVVGVGLALAPAVLQAQDGPFPLWDDSLPVPKVAELAPLAGVEFHVIKPCAPDQDGYHWLHGVALAWHQGRLVVSFGHNRGLENTASEVANGCASSDGGRTWGPVFQIDDGAEENLAVSHGVFLSHQGRLWAFHGAFHGRLQNVHTRAYLLDEISGEWQPRGVVVEGGFWPMQEPQKMEDGNWIMAGLCVTAGYGGVDDPAAVALSHGDDLARWDLVVVPKPAKMKMWGESTLILPRGTGNRPAGSGPNEAERMPAPAITLISRYGKNWPLGSVSDDYGRSWTIVREGNLPMAPSKPYAGLLSTGQRYLVGTTTADSGRARRPLTIALSRPGEEQFSRLFTIRHSHHQGPGESHPNAALAYPYAIEHDGKLYVGYSNSGGRGGNRNSAELAIIPLESLR